MSTGGLSGLVVLEVADTLGAAFAVSMMADYNATAIICEPPEGSALRRLGPAALDAARWAILARNKQSIAADWNDPDQAGLIDRLLRRTDILVIDIAKPAQSDSPWFRVLATIPETERPLVVEIFPTGADEPELWPWSRRPEFAGAASGVMALTGHTGKTPIQAEAPLTDYLAGTLAAVRALIELRRARLAGVRPNRISTPLHQALHRMIEWQTPVATAKGRAETRMANNFPMNAGIANMHPTGDGKYVAISAVTQTTAMRLMNMVGGAALCADPRFATAAARSVGLDDLYAKIDAWTGARSTPQILETAGAQDVVLGPIYTTDDILADEQIAARGNIVTIDGLSMPSVTPRLSSLETHIRHLGPAIGADSANVLKALELAPTSPPADLTYQGEGKKLLVIELGAVIAGPFAGSLMAELGATVIKIETPGAGDSLRLMGPAKDGQPLWFGVSAREKNCVTINLKHAEGKALFLRLIAQADMLIENVRPGVLERLGLDWDTLKAANPSLVMLSISGFGQTGPQRTRPGFGKIAEGLSGIVNLTGEADKSPLFVGFSLADASAGLFGIFGAATALYQRDIAGLGGGRIDIALYEPLMRMLDCQLALHDLARAPPSRSGGNDPYGFGIASSDRPRFESVGSISGNWYLVAVPHRNDGLSRRIAADGAASLEAWGRTRDDAEIEAALTALGLEFSPVFDGMQIANAPYFQARGDVAATDHPVLGRITASGRIDGSKPEPAFRAPALGEDNAAVFSRFLGLDRAEIERLSAAGAI